jgi:hypothetical protein
MRIFKPIYKNNCDWCKFLRFGLVEDIADCTKTGEKIIFKEEILENKTCENFKCCTVNRTFIDILKDLFRRNK